MAKRVWSGRYWDRPIVVINALEAACVDALTFVIDQGRGTQEEPFVYVASTDATEPDAARVTIRFGGSSVRLEVEGHDDPQVIDSFEAARDVLCYAARHEKPQRWREYLPWIESHPVTVGAVLIPFVLFGLALLLR